MALNKGDKIKTRKDLFNQQLFRFGVVQEVYKSTADWQGNCRNMYSVKWDDTGNIERGYIDNGGLILVEAAKLD